MQEAEYWKKVAKYAVSEGCNSFLLEQLMSGYSAFNLIIAKRIEVDFSLKKMYSNPDPERTKVPDDSFLTDLIIQMRKTIGLKRSLSNTLFDFQFDAKKCENISQKILAYEKEIEVLRYRIKNPNENSSQSTDTVDSNSNETAVSQSKYELEKQLRGVRSMISQVKLECEQLALQGDKTKLEKREKRLVELKVKKETLENKIKEVAE